MSPTRTAWEMPSCGAVGHRFLISLSSTVIGDSFRSSPTLGPRCCTGRDAGATGAYGLPLRSPMVRFLLLGPIEVWRDEERVPLGKGRERALLVRLLLARGHPVSSDALVADLWGEASPAQGTAQVRTHVSRLRR